MEQQDYFMEIAKTKHPGSATDREIEALPAPDKLFARTEGSRLEDMLQKTFDGDYEASKARFAPELAEMKEKYLPFMADMLTPAEETIQLQELRQFRFRYLEKDECFTHRWDGDQEWEDVTIPDYRGPGREEGKWSGYYTCRFRMADGWKDEIAAGKRVVLNFQCVDYIAEVYVNGCFAGSHEGFFAPFSIDVTKFMENDNELVILCKNDIPILGEGPYLDGDKIYAATGPGWDDPEIGWHHCPAGAGVFGRVTVELRPALFLEDVFVRTDIDSDTAEVRIGLMNYTDEVQFGGQLQLVMEPRNFEGGSIGTYEKELLCVGSGKNEFRFFVPVGEYRLWDTETPWLYAITVNLTVEEKLVSNIRRSFGFKKFISDESSEPKGKFYLNHKPVVLRGANEMGHLQQCVMKGDMDQLIDDILIAKMCNLNYYRVTQRPVQAEIYDYFDMLGMMHQCDFPLFSYLRRPQFAEALRQVVEMEHLIRGHVSTVMVSLINEPVCIRRTSDPNDKFSRRYDAKGHRHLLRDELEAFFSAARKAIYTENPDRVVKNVEGDYDGPTLEGMPDFHTYTMWYTNHGEPIGRLMRGFMPPVKAGWMTGCGEYGAEGLDNEDIMRNLYPAEWIEEVDGKWYPDKIVRSQTHSVQGDWYPEQHTMKDWIRESQLHQARATKLMTDAFRRRGDIINQTAIHLLIDAWPAGWMKTLLGCDRKPKPAYFAYQEALIPLKVNLYTPRSGVYEGESIPVEAWVMNDTSKDRRLTVRAEVWTKEDGSGERKLHDAYLLETQVNAAGCVGAGVIPVEIPKTGKPETVFVTAAILNERQEVIHGETISFRAAPRVLWSKPVCCLDEEAVSLIRALSGAIGEGTEEPGSGGCLTGTAQSDETDRMKGIILPGEEIGSDEIVISGSASDAGIILRHVRKGGRGLLLMDGWQKGALGDSMADGGTLTEEKQIRLDVKGCGELFFVAAAEEYRGFMTEMLYNQEKGYIDATIDRTIDTDLEGREILYTYGKQGFLGSRGEKPHLPAVMCCSVGEGKLYLSTLSLKGRVGYNNGLDGLLLQLLEEMEG